MSPEEWVARGYREYPPPRGVTLADRCFQRRVRDERGIKYFINAQLYRFHEREAWECDVCCETDTGGHGWLKFREDTIDAVEARAARLWAAAGSVYYEEDTAP